MDVLDLATDPIRSDLAVTTQLLHGDVSGAGQAAIGTTYDMWGDALDVGLGDVGRAVDGVGSAVNALPGFGWLL